QGGRAHGRAQLPAGGEPAGAHRTRPGGAGRGDAGRVRGGRAVDPHARASLGARPGRQRVPADHRHQPGGPGLVLLTRAGVVSRGRRDCLTLRPATITTARTRGCVQSWPWGRPQLHTGGRAQPSSSSATGPSVARVEASGVVVVTATMPSGKTWMAPPSKSWIHPGSASRSSPVGSPRALSSPPRAHHAVRMSPQTTYSPESGTS